MTTHRLRLADAFVGAFAASLLLAGTLDAAPPVANRALSIPEAPAPDESSRAHTPPDVDPDWLNTLVDETAAAAATPAAAPPATTPVIDAFNATPLGPTESPSEIIAAAQANLDAAADDAEGSLVSWFDPRANDIARVVGALAVVVGLMLLFASLAKRLGGRFATPGRPSGVIEILARYPVGKGRHLVLIKLVRRVILVHQTSAGMTPITEVTDADEVAALLTRVEAGGPRSKGPEFHAALAKMTGAEGAGSSGAKGRRGPVVETIDLTRTQSRRLSQLTGAGGGG